MSVAAAGALLAALAVSCAVFAPLARRATSPPGRVSHPDRRALDEANWPPSLWRWELLRAGCIVAGAIVSLATPLPFPVMVAAAAVAPSVVVRWRAGAVRSRARRTTTHLLRATEAALRSGASLPESLRRACGAVTEDRLARRPFVDALRAFDLGAPLDAALRDAARCARDGRSRIALETLAMGIASRLPYDRAGTLVAAVADRLAFEERLDEEIRARTAGLRSQVVLLALVVPGIAAYLAFTIPSLAATLGQPIGRFVLIPAALALEVIGIIASRRAVDGAQR
jgi:Flp pilus assembly protein TadB